MNDDIIKFRKICKELYEAKRWKKSAIAADVKLSGPIFKRILDPKSDNDLKSLRPSTLARIQDFNKKHITLLDYIGIGADTPASRLTEEEIKDLKKEIEAQPLLRIKPGVKEAREKELKERIGSNQTVSQGAKNFLTEERINKSLEELREKNRELRKERIKGQASDLLEMIKKGMGPGVIVVEINDSVNDESYVTKTINLEIELRIKVK